MQSHCQSHLHYSCTARESSFRGAGGVEHGSGAPEIVGIQVVDVCDDDILRGLRVANGVSDPTSSDKAEVDQNFAEGKLRGVDGSPHFFTSGGSFFCPSLTIEHEGTNYDVSFDAATFQRFVEAAFG